VRPATIWSPLPAWTDTSESSRSANFRKVFERLFESFAMLRDFSPRHEEILDVVLTTRFYGSTFKLWTKLRQIMTHARAVRVRAAVPRRFSPGHQHPQVHTTGEVRTNLGEGGAGKGRSPSAVLYRRRFASGTTRKQLMPCTTRRVRDDCTESGAAVRKREVTAVTRARGFTSRANPRKPPTPIEALTRDTSMPNHAFGVANDRSS